jgi:hypothetical protein
VCGNIPTLVWWVDAASDEPKPNSKLYFPVQSAAVIDGKTSSLLP